MPLLELRILEIHSFPHFSLTCFNISGWNFTYDFVLLYYRSSSSVVNSRQFLMELYPFRNVEYWKFTVFPHFSLTRFDILSWNFACDFVLLYYRLSFSVLNLRWFLWELCPFWKSEYWKYSFLHFFLRALTYSAENLHMTLFNVQKIKFECHNSVSVWLSVRPSIFCIFLLHTSTHLAEN